MQLRRIRLEHFIRIFLGVAVVCLLAGQAAGSSPLKFVGGVMLGVVLFPAIVIGTGLLIMRITGWGMTRPQRPHPGQKTHAPEPAAGPGSSGESSPPAR